MIHGEMMKMNSINVFEELKGEIVQQINRYAKDDIPAYTKQRLSEAIVTVLLNNISEINKVMNGDISEADIENYMYSPTLPKQNNQNPTQLELPFETQYKAEPIFKNENDLW